MKMTTGTIDNILTRLQGVRESANGWQALCPAHEDKQASLSITAGKDGKILLHCHAGCSIEAVTEAIGIKASDLFPKAVHRIQSAEPRRIEAAYNYVDESGKLLYQVVRYKPKGFRQRKPNGKGGWDWNVKDTSKVLYRLPKVKDAVSRRLNIFIVEGEKDVETLESLGLTATCNVGGAGKWQDTYSSVLSGADVVILPDNDAAGKKHAEQVAESLHGHAASIKIIELPDLSPKGDISDWIAAGHTAEELTALVSKTQEWKPKEDSTADTGTDFPLTDLGNSERLIAAYGSDLRYDVNSGKWLVWNGRVWEPDNTGQVNRMARQVIRSMYALLQDCSTQAERDALYSHIRKSESAPRLAAMVELAKYCPNIPVQSSDLDDDKWSLNCLNGTMDLRTGKIAPHRRENLITKLVPVEYDESAACPTWERFLSEIFDNDSELITFVQKAAGYGLTGDTSEQCFFMLHGNGSNGKSTFLTVIREILADYHRKTGTDTLLDKEAGGPTNDIARLRGARFVSAIEAKPGKKLAEALVKELTGNDVISARFLHHEFFEFVPEFKLWLACNHLPHIDGQDNAIWRRIRLIPFKVQFQDTGTSAGPYKDMMLPDKLRMEYSGILAWMVQGCLLWQSERLGAPSAVKEATNKYQSDMDVLSDFFDECCVIGTQYKSKSSELYNIYAEWSRARGEKYPLSNRTFSQRLEERNQFQKYDSAGCKWWRGIGIVEYVDDVDPNLLFSPIDNEIDENTQNDSTSSTPSTIEEEQEYEPGCEG
ncbi:MAG: phage/plasmid primase, P4 family [Armatimonadota bacterium]